MVKGLRGGLTGRSWREIYSNMTLVPRKLSTGQSQWETRDREPVTGSHKSVSQGSEQAGKGDLGVPMEAVRYTGACSHPADHTESWLKWTNIWQSQGLQLSKHFNGSSLLSTATSTTVAQSCQSDPTLLLLSSKSSNSFHLI